MKSIAQLLGLSEKYSKPSSVVFEKNLPPGVMGEIDMNGVITIDGRMTEKQKAKTVAHERCHLKQIRTGVLRFDTNNYYYKKTGRKTKVIPNSQIDPRKRNLIWEKKCK
jgi:ABC-type cobalamin transport system ATPase subunit|tara:strand:+ start:377 stop:703 length:327 start_codon:yes stop_codon:yes gene_type:complete